jgi:hypothetical protein
MTPPHPQTAPGDLVYSSTPWKMYRQDVGMGEYDYAVFLNDVFFCRTERSQTAHEIIGAIRFRASHSSAAGGAVLDKVDKRVENAIRKARANIESTDPSLYDYSCILPFEEVREWIKELRSQQQRECEQR